MVQKIGYSSEMMNFFNLTRLLGTQTCSFGPFITHVGLEKMSCSEGESQKFVGFFMCVLGKAEKTPVRAEWHYLQNSSTLKIW